MSQSSSGVQLRQGSLGTYVAGAAKALPATATAGIFTISGGRAIITHLSGIVATTIQNQACTLSLGFTPSGGANVPTALATATSIINLASGSFVAAPQNQAGLVVAGTGIGILSPGNGATSVCSLPGDGGIAIAGVGTVTITTSATNTGTIQWSLCYVPLDPSAVIAAL